MQNLHAPLPKKFIVESSIADIMQLTNTLVSVVRSLDKSKNFNSWEERSSRELVNGLKYSAWL